MFLGNTPRCQMFAFSVTGIKTGFNVRANLVAAIKSQAFAITFGMILNSVKLVTCYSQIIIQPIQFTAGTELIFLITMTACLILQFRTILLGTSLAFIVNRSAYRHRPLFKTVCTAINANMIN